MSSTLPASPGAAPPSPWLVPILTLGSAVNILSARALPVFLPVIAADLGTSVSLLGQVPALMLLLAGLLALVAGPLADRYGYRRTLVIGLAGVVVSAVATGLAPDVPLLLAFTLVGAIARAAVLPTAQAVVVQQIADEPARRRALSWVTSSLSAASIVGIPLLTAVAAALTWRVSFFTLAGLALAAALILRWTLAPDTVHVGGPLRPRALLAAYAPIRRHRPTVVLVAATVASDIGIWTTFTYISAFLLDRHAFSIDGAGWVYFGIGLASLLGVMLSGGRLGAAPWPLLLGSRAAMAVVLGTALALPLPWTVSVPLVLLSGFVAGTGDVATTLALTAVSPAGRATTLTFRSAAVCLGTAAGSSLGGLLLAVADYAALGICSFASLAVAAVLVRLARPDAGPEPIAASP